MYVQCVTCLRGDGLEAWEEEEVERAPREGECRGESEEEEAEQEEAEVSTKPEPNCCRAEVIASK